jgi:acyl-CoA thioester hydrolase
MKGHGAPTPQDPSETAVLHRREVRLTYADCDPAGILYYATWFPWMERVQSEWFFLNGLRQDKLMENHGFSTVTRHAECEYLNQVGLFDTIELNLVLRRIGSTSLTLGCDMWWHEGASLAARGSITIVTLSPDNAPIRVPTMIRDAVTRAMPPGSCVEGSSSPRMRRP